MAGKVTKSLKERFLSKVKKTSYCWIWTAARTTKRYGKIWVGHRNEFAHRVSYTIFKGRFDQKLNILHRCDNPPCVNPAHLFIGNHAINGMDKRLKGRAAKGEKNGNSKLTVDDVRAIRKSTLTYSELAKEYGIDQTQVWNIRKKHHWKHV